MSKWFHPTIQSHSKIPGSLDDRNLLFIIPYEHSLLLDWFYYCDLFCNSLYIRNITEGTWSLDGNLRPYNFALDIKILRLFCTNTCWFYHWLFEFYHPKLLQNIWFMVWMMYEPFLVIKSLASVYNSCRAMETNKVTLCCEQI